MSTRLLVAVQDTGWAVEVARWVRGQGHEAPLTFVADLGGLAHALGTEGAAGAVIVDGDLLTAGGVWSLADLADAAGAPPVIVRGEPASPTRVPLRGRVLRVDREDSVPLVGALVEACLGRTLGLVGRPMADDVVDLRAVDPTGIEPVTSAMQRQRSAN